jgi:hypothetical protein
MEQEERVREEKKRERSEKDGEKESRTVYRIADAKLVSTRVAEMFRPPSSFHSLRDLEHVSGASGNH